MIGFPEPVAYGIASSAAVYLVADARVRRLRGRGAPRARRLAFLAGLVVIAVALIGPVDRAAATSFPAHMVQHLLLTMVAAPLLLMGAPLTVALGAWRGRPRRFLLAVLRSGLVRVLTHPLAAWSVFFVAMWGAHLSGLYDATLRNENLHVLEHAVFLTAALLFWMPLVDADPMPSAISYPARVLYLFAAMPAMAFLGLTLASAGRVLYPTYASVDGAERALADQATAGALMWGGTMVLLVPALGFVLWDWMMADEREARRVDARLDGERAMTEVSG